MVEGSDCPSGKEQLTRAGAQEKAARLRASTGRDVKKYRCMLCETYHVGNTSKRDSRRARGSKR